MQSRIWLSVIKCIFFPPLSMCLYVLDWLESACSWSHLWDWNQQPKSEALSDPSCRRRHLILAGTVMKVVFMENVQNETTIHGQLANIMHFSVSLYTQFQIRHILYVISNTISYVISYTSSYTNFCLCLFCYWSLVIRVQVERSGRRKSGWCWQNLSWREFRGRMRVLFVSWV